MCRVLAYIGPEIPLSNLLLKPENSLINQSLDPEGHPDLQLAGWGFAAWGEHLLEEGEPFLYRRPMAAFYDDNASRMIPSLRGSTMLAHVRAAAYDAKVVLADENCHPYSFSETPWIVAQNGDLPHWQQLQRELLQHCEDRYLTQMRGTTDTEFLYVLLLSLLEGDSNEEVQAGFEKMLELIVAAMKKLDLVALTKLKMALVAPGRIIGVNIGCGHDGDTTPEGDWKELRKAGPGTDDYALSMLLEPLYLQSGRNFENYEDSFELDACPPDEATAVVLASEPLTESTEDWVDLEYGHIVFLEKKGDSISQTIRSMSI